VRLQSCHLRYLTRMIHQECIRHLKFAELNLGYPSYCLQWCSAIQWLLCCSVSIPSNHLHPAQLRSYHQRYISRNMRRVCIRHLRFAELKQSNQSCCFQGYSAIQWLLCCSVSLPRNHSLPAMLQSYHRR